MSSSAISAASVVPAHRAGRRAFPLACLWAGLLWLPSVWAHNASLANLPLYFEAGRCQAGLPGQFSARSRDGLFLFNAWEAEITLARPGSLTTEPETALAQWAGPRMPQTATLHVQFLAANAQARIVGTSPLAARVNYLTGSDPAEWQRNVPTFARIEVQDLYPGIRLTYYGNARQLEYDFVVAPGADPQAIAFRMGGADRLEVDAGGDLLVHCGTDTFRERRPVLYQLRGSQRQPIPGGYRLSAANTVAFEVGPYDRALPLVIDPVLSYSSFLGGQGGDTGRAIAMDGSGNLYLAGDTISGQLASTNALEPAFRSGYLAVGGDAFVAKFDNTGSNLVYLTYLGGTGDDAAVGVAVDPEGNAYVTGVTDSTNFPTAPAGLAISNSIAGKGEIHLGVHPFDAFVSKLTPDGSALVYSTYLGGSGQDEGLGIAVNPNTFCAYVTGFTESTNFPTTPGALRRTLGGRANVFVTAIASNGLSLVYSTFLGGSNIDHGEGIAVDGQGRAYLTGYTLSTNFPVTPNALQVFQSNEGHSSDAFVTVLETNGASVVASTFLGGLGADIGYRLRLDSAGNVYVTGSESGIGFPITPGNLNPGGVFISGDGAGSWTNSGPGLLHNQVYGIALDTNTTPPTLYAVNGRGISLSTNGGAAWSTSFNSLTQYVAVAIDPATPSTLYAGGLGVLKSTNSGASWFTNSTGLTHRPVNKLVVDPQAPATLYAATEGGGVFKSTDAAASWQAANAGLGDFRVRDLVLASTSPGVLYAATPSGVYRSGDDAAHWQVSRSGLTNLLTRALAVDPQTTSTVYVGTERGAAFKSIDAGTNWFPLNIGLNSSNVVTALAVDPQTPATVYAGTTNGLFQSLNGGTNWSVATNGLTFADIATIVINPLAPSTLYAGVFGTDGFGTLDAFLTKFSPGLGSVVYSVALGGGEVDQGWDVAVDGAGDAFVVGATFSTNFPIAQAVGFLSVTNNGGTNSATSDAFVTAINPDASAFLYSAYLGAGSNDTAMSVVADAAGNAYVLGQTFSIAFPTVGARQTALYGDSDAFLAIIQLNSPVPAITVQTAPAGLMLVVDGVTNTSPFSTNWPAGSFHSIAAITNQSGGPGVQYVLNSWDDAGAPSHQVVAPVSGSATYTASFDTQYFLTLLGSGAGSAGPQSGWFPAGTNLVIRATPASGAAFAGWTGTGSGSFSGPDNPATVTMNGPVTETAAFTGAGNDVLTVVKDGNGSVSPDLNGKTVRLGSTVTLTATPAAGYAFTGWTGSTNSANPTVNFVMQNGLVLEAHFAPNPVAQAKGSYAGLYFATNALGLSDSGYFTASVADNGGFSARIRYYTPQVAALNPNASFAYGGFYIPQGIFVPHAHLVQRSSSFSGRFSSSGYASNSIPRARPLRHLSVTLQLDLSGGNTLTGQVSDGQWTAQLLANRAVFTAANPAPEAGRKYTVLLPGGAESLGQPGGDSFATVSVTSPGSVHFSAALADGTRVSQSTFLSEMEQFPVFLPAFRDSGLLLGWLTFTNAPDTDLTGPLDWFKIAQSVTNTYPGGFLLESQALGSLYSVTSGVPVLDFGAGPGELVLVSGGLAESLTNQVSLSPGNVFGNLGPNPLSLTLSTSSGLFNGSLRDPAVSRNAIPLHGIVLQKQNRGAGYFSFTNQIGRVLLGP